MPHPISLHSMQAVARKALTEQQADNTKRPQSIIKVDFNQVKANAPKSPTALVFSAKHIGLRNYQQDACTQISIPSPLRVLTQEQ